MAELAPNDGEAPVVLAVIAMIFWKARFPDWRARDLVDPIFMMAVLGWVLGLKLDRFWQDWGMPAALVWLALQLQQQFERFVDFDSVKRFAIVMALAAAVYLAMAGDQHGRWTWNATKKFLTPDDPDLVGWLPEDNGIIYSADMAVFFETFYKNPNAPWRYALGFESALMRPDDLAVVRKVQWNYSDLHFYGPWLQKMRPQDRLILTPDVLPANSRDRAMAIIPELEWHHAANDWWIGRPRRTPSGLGKGRK